MKTTLKITVAAILAVALVSPAFAAKPATVKKAMTGMELTGRVLGGAIANTAYYPAKGTWSTMKWATKPVRWAFTKKAYIGPTVIAAAPGTITAWELAQNPNFRDAVVEVAKEFGSTVADVASTSWQLAKNNPEVSIPAAFGAGVVYASYAGTHGKFGLANQLKAKAAKEEAKLAQPNVQ